MNATFYPLTKDGIIIFIIYLIIQIKIYQIRGLKLDLSILTIKHMKCWQVAKLGAAQLYAKLKSDCHKIGQYFYNECLSTELEWFISYFTLNIRGIK